MFTSSANLEGAKINESWSTSAKVGGGVVGTVAIVSLVIGILAILAAHGFQLGELSKVGNIGGGVCIGLGLAVPLLILGVLCCRKTGTPKHGEPQIGDRDIQGMVWFAGEWVTPNEIILKECDRKKQDFRNKLC